MCLCMFRCHMISSTNGDKNLTALSHAMGYAWICPLQRGHRRQNDDKDMLASELEKWAEKAGNS